MYLICPSCGHLFADKQIEFEEKSDEINNNKSLNSETKTAQISELINSLGFINPCCKMRIISNIRQEKIIVAM
jgi:DNA-directed RNA polymerase subunit N (RpoN/RPB10)